MGLAIALMAIIASFFVPEVRQRLGFDVQVEDKQFFSDNFSYAGFREPGDLNGKPLTPRRKRFWTAINTWNNGSLQTNGFKINAENEHGPGFSVSPVGYSDIAACDLKLTNGTYKIRAILTLMPTSETRKDAYMSVNFLKNPGTFESAPWQATVTSAALCAHPDGTWDFCLDSPRRTTSNIVQTADHGIGSLLSGTEVDLKLAWDVKNNKFTGWANDTLLFTNFDGNKAGIDPKKVNFVGFASDGNLGPDSRIEAFEVLHHD